jgi:hypothetical protein
MLRRIALCLLFAPLAGVPQSHAAPQMEVQVVQTHSGVNLGAGSPADADTSVQLWTRCSGESGTYTKDWGFYCQGPAVAGDPKPGEGGSSSLFFDISVITPDSARVVFHCSTVLDPTCEGFPEYPKSTSVVCSDFVFAGSAYKDCTATGSSAEAIGVYKAALHGDRMTIYGANWERHYHKYGTWQYGNSPAETPTPGPNQISQEATPPVPPHDEPPSDANSATTQDSKPALPDANPATSTDGKPAPQPTLGTEPGNVPVPGLPPAEAADQVIDPHIIEQAKAGDMVAQYKLGYDYFLGHGVPLDYVQAAIWWRKAADQGFPQAQNNLGVLYNAGKGVPQSYAEAYFWQNLATARASGPLQAQFAKNRDESGSKLWFMVRLRIQQRAAKWAADHPVPARSQEPREAKQ